ncbi:unnamed protein product [Calicophoron daubneyi]|uniref:Sodium/potassium-transporting ATPase subunit beta n=1 Tax=Calicophoron daubneyi TaxID=300641 RepID=A0AAV2TNZ5_CALDB
MISSTKTSADWRYKNCPVEYESRNFHTHQERGLLEFQCTNRDYLMLMVFYSVFYISLFILAACLLSLFMWKIIDGDKPYLSGQHSALLNEPGLAVVPMVDTRNTLIHFKSGHKETFSTYVDALFSFMQIYEDGAYLQNSQRDCDLPGGIHFDTMTHLQTCAFDPKWAYSCNMNRLFGYDDGKPCFILTLNRVYGWLPPSSSGTKVCCHGATPNDDDFLGPMCFYDALVHDKAGCNRTCGIFPHQYYPYLNQKSYLSPLVFVELQKPHKNVLISIRCELAKVDYRASFDFGILID